MFDNFVRVEKISSFMRSTASYPLEILQAIPKPLQLFIDDIGAHNFDVIIRDISKAVRNNKSAVDELMSNIRTSSALKDVEYLGHLQTLEVLVHEAMQKLHQEYFPYELTRTPTKSCLCYRKLNALQLAEYASELIFGNYTRPSYLTVGETLTDDYILSKLAGGLGEVSESVSY